MGLAPGEPAAPDFIAACVLGICAMAAVQAGTARLIGNDSYYHLKMARLMPELGFVQRFPWLHWTIFREQFVSHHYGFHLLVAPLIWAGERITGDPVLAAKGVVCLSMGAAAGVFHALLRSRGIVHRFWWVLLLCCLPWQFWLRMSYFRAPVVGLPLLLLATLLVIHGRWLAVSLLALTFTHVYGGAVLVPLVPLAFVAGALLAGDPCRPYVRTLAAAVAGITAGLVINPYFPQNVAFLRTQLFETGLGSAPDVGSEWKPYTSWFLFQQALPLAGVWVLSLARRLARAERGDAVELGSLMLQLGFLVLTLKARRFIEYWPVFALLNAAYFGRWSFVSDSPDSTPAARRRRRMPSPVPVLAAVAIGAVAVATLRQARRHGPPSQDHDAIRPAMAYLQRVSPRGALVFTDDWDVFPALFYYNHWNHYVVGLDPVFTQSRYPELWERYKLITRGRTPARLPRRVTNGRSARVTLDDIAGVFDADYVYVAADHAKLFRQLCGRPGRFTLIYPPAGKGDARRQPPVALFKVRRPANNVEQVHGGG